MAKGANKKERGAGAAAADHVALPTDGRKAKKALGRLEAKLSSARAAEEKRRRRLDEAIAAVRSLEAQIAALASSSPAPADPVSTDPPPADPAPLAAGSPTATRRRRARRPEPDA